MGCLKNYSKGEAYEGFTNKDLSPELLFVAVELYRAMAVGSEDESCGCPVKMTFGCMG